MSTREERSAKRGVHFAEVNVPTNDDAPDTIMIQGTPCDVIHFEGTFPLDFLMGAESVRSARGGAVEIFHRPDDKPVRIAVGEIVIRAESGALYVYARRTS